MAEMTDMMVCCQRIRRVVFDQIKVTSPNLNPTNLQLLLDAFLEKIRSDSIKDILFDDTTIKPILERLSRVHPGDTPQRVLQFFIDTTKELYQRGLPHSSIQDAMVEFSNELLREAADRVAKAVNYKEASVTVLPPELVKLIQSAGLPILGVYQSQESSQDQPPSPE
jgi:hypothetical protein